MTVEDISEGGTTSLWTTVNGITNTSYALSGLQEGTFYKVQVQTVKDGRQSEWSDAFFITEEGTDIQLTDNGDNSAIIAAKVGKVRNVTLAGRTLYKDGSWNTLCLPFDVTIAGTPPASPLVHLILLSGTRPMTSSAPSSRESPSVARCTI